jgi:dienelactone hydrolase
MCEFPKAADIQAFSIQPQQQAAFRVVRFFLTRQGKGDHVPVTLWLPGGKLQARQTALLAHRRGSQAFEESGAPGKFVESLLKQGSSVMIPDLFNSGKAAVTRNDARKYFTTYNRTDEANRVQDMLTCLAYIRSQGSTPRIRVVGFEGAGLIALLARGLATDDAAFAIDLEQFNPTSDEAFLKRLNIALIRRAGDLRSAAVLNLQAPLWGFNAAQEFPAGWIQSVFESTGKGALLKIETQPAAEDKILEWLLQGLQRYK